MLTILIVSVLWMSLFGAEGGRVPWLPDDFARSAVAAVTDDARREQLRKTLAKMRRTMEGYHTRVSAVVRDMRILSRHHATRAADFDAYIDHLVRKRRIAQRDLMDASMALRKLMTRAEWAAALQAAQPDPPPDPLD